MIDEAVMGMAGASVRVRNANRTVVGTALLKSKVAIRSVARGFDLADWISWRGASDCESREVRVRGPWVAAGATVAVGGMVGGLQFQLGYLTTRASSHGPSSNVQPPIPVLFPMQPS